MSYIAAMLLMYEDEYCSFMIFYNMITKPFIIPFFLFNESYVKNKYKIFYIIIRFLKFYNYLKNAFHNNCQNWVNGCKKKKSLLKLMLLNGF